MTMMDNTKRTIWNAGVLIGRWLPSAWRLAIVRLLCAASENRADPPQALRELFLSAGSVDEYLDAAAIHYEKGIHPKHRLMNYHAFFTNKLTAQNTVLDVGCGYGAVAYSMATSGATVTGIDMNEDNIRRAKELYRHPRLTFCVGKVPEVLPEGRFDTVVLSNVLEHIEQRQHFMSRLQEAVRPKRWLIRVPMINRDWTVPLRQELGLFAYSDPTHQTEYTEETFRDEMQTTGLIIQEICINWGEIWAFCVPAHVDGDQQE